MVKGSFGPEAKKAFKSVLASVHKWCKVTEKIIFWGHLNLLQLKIQGSSQQKRSR
jgi:hypothetical protein